MKFIDSIRSCVRSFLWRVRDWINRLRRATPRLRGTNAENCLSLQTTEVAEILRREWHAEKNGEITPADIARGSGRKAWWKCSACGHEWQARVFSRYAGCGCPECAKVKAAWTRRLKKDKYQLQLFEISESFG